MTAEVRLICGDCLAVLPTLEENSVDTIITDPPYGLKFMGKDWDYGVPGVPFWEAAFRIAKPGAMLFAFGGTRTHHRLMCAIEDAGWEIRDCLMWLYGSGFPKSLDISKAIDKAAEVEREVIGRRTDRAATPKQDIRGGNLMNGVNSGIDCSAITGPATDLAKQWDGHGTALKPAWEPIILAMKPLDGTFAQNAEKWGVAGLWIDGSRIETGESWAGGKAAGTPGVSLAGSVDGSLNIQTSGSHPDGRWPANLILDEAAAAELDERVGNRTSGKMISEHTRHGSQPWFTGGEIHETYGDSGSASRFFFCAKASKAEREAGLDGLPATHPVFGDEGSTYQGLSNSKTLRANSHPCCKPLGLMRYLCTLSRTPTGGVVLDPFMGSGSTGVACKQEGRSFIGIELDHGYHEIARRRIDVAQHTPQQMELDLT